MPNTTFQTESNFDNVYFHAKSQVKNKIYSKIYHKNAMIMQNLSEVLKNKFDNLYFHAKSQVKSKKYHKIKCYISLKSYDHGEFKSGAWERI